MEPEPNITVRPNGPYLVGGGVPISRRHVVTSELDEPLDWQTGERLETKPMIALCRCGGSQSKPLCDGTHAKIGFDGPLLVTGAIPVQRADGEPFEARDRMTLCRCGQSAIKPLCDGTHATVGFTDH